jgi:hypothetical protein
MNGPVIALTGNSASRPCQTVRIKLRKDKQPRRVYRNQQGNPTSHNIAQRMSAMIPAREKNATDDGHNEGGALEVPQPWPIELRHARLQSCGSSLHDVCQAHMHEISKPGKLWLRAIIFSRSGKLCAPGSMISGTDDVRHVQSRIHDQRD